MALSNLQLVTKENDEDAIGPVCDSEPYPRFNAGIYQARCIAAKIYRDPMFRRWTCRLQFHILANGTKVFGFLNLGNAPAPTSPRGSRFRRAWVIANGTPPRKRQQMGSSVFAGKIFSVQVADSKKRWDGIDHAKGDVYSIVKEILQLGP